MGIEPALAEWRSTLGDSAVLASSAALRGYAECTTGDIRCVPAALRPVSAEQVPRVVAIAAAHRVPLYPISTGRNWGYGCALPVRDGCVLLDLSQLKRIREFDPELGVVTVEPGVTQGTLAAFLEDRAADHMVPVSGAGPSASILGNALERGYGITPVVDHFLAVQSIEVVLPDGRLYRPALSALGGREADQVFKWGVGPYLDGLFAQGNFGVVTAMTIALARRPERVKAFVFGVRDADALPRAIDAIRGTLQRLPGLVGGINVMNRHRILAMAAPFPHAMADADGLLTNHGVADVARRYRVDPWTVFGTLYGSRRTVRAAQAEIRRFLGPVARRIAFVSPGGARRLRRVARLLSRGSTTSLARRAGMLESTLDIVEGRPRETALSLAYWKAERRAGRSDVALNPSHDGCGIIWYTPLVVMKPDVVARFVDFATEVMRRHRIEPLITLTSVSDRCFDSSVPLLFDRRDDAATERAKTCYRALLDEGAREGFVPYRVGISAMDWLVQSGAVAWDVVAEIKKALDPFGIIAPGRYSRA